MLNIETYVVECVALKGMQTRYAISRVPLLLIKYQRDVINHSHVFIITAFIQQKPWRLILLFSLTKFDLFACDNSRPTIIRPITSCMLKKVIACRILQKCKKKSTINL